MKQVVIYPRGFAAYDVGWPIVRLEAELSERVVAARFSKVNAREVNTVSAANVERLYADLAAGHRKPGSPDFIEDLYAVFCNAFGTPSFYEWLHIQEQNPRLSASHAKFLMETLEFIFGKPRMISYGAWRVLLTQSASGAASAEDYAYQKHFIGRDKEYFGVQYIARRWLAQPEGAGDMVRTLHLLFGDFKAV